MGNQMPTSCDRGGWSGLERRPKREPILQSTNRGRELVPGSEQKKEHQPFRPADSSATTGWGDEEMSRNQTRPEVLQSAIMCWDVSIRSHTSRFSYVRVFNFWRHGCTRFVSLPWSPPINHQTSILPTICPHSATKPHLPNAQCVHGSPFWGTF
jgi:hypothetical protein